ncbi:MAG: transketolase [Candidatus Lambdaproteobacteria bacterium RIFOXYD2_FULL_50_16]|uniref:Transketolase n=1 Tax=Candidatus Lambdaproteobacteria bacterium RIFOXYD2_FULL_50_16 TaxID=1817772 RepID=A0A1F6G9P2_9PROT|nr:MAG: transketolase [Candidatus Lambdaproteobacteria bacterium RIFOXYD2_FULL_50_16]
MGLEKKTMRDALLDGIYQKMKEDKKIFFLTADFGAPVLDKIRAEFPKRCINVSIAEQNLINVATGLALEGYTVFAYAIAPFITMRCYEQVRVNLAILSEIRELNVNLIGVGAGFSYDMSGPTHQAFEDLAIMRLLPNVEVFCPAEWNTAAALLDHALASKKPKYFRFDSKPQPGLYEGPVPLKTGFAELKKGQGTCLIATGYPVHVALKAAAQLSSEGNEVGVVDFFGLKTFDPDALAALMGRYRQIISLEETFVGKGGLDSLLLYFANERGIPVKIKVLGVPENYRFEIASRDELHEQRGMGLSQILAAARR